MEAYTLLKDNNCLPGYFYSFTEEIPFQDNALSQCGKEKLMKAIVFFLFSCSFIRFLHMRQIHFSNWLLEFGNVHLGHARSSNCCWWEAHRAYQAYLQKSRKCCWRVLSMVMEATAIV